MISSERAPFMILMLCLIASQATASSGLRREFKSPRGFSLEYPAEWLVVSRDEDMDRLRTLFAGEFSLDGIDFSEFALFVFDSEMDDFVENVNVAVRSEVVPMETDAEIVTARSRVRASMHASARALGGRARDASVTLETIGDRQAVVGRYSVDGVVRPLRQIQVMIPGDENVLFIVCTAEESAFDAYEQVFNDMYRSVRIHSGWPLWLLILIPASACGGLLAFMWLWRVRRAGAAQIIDNVAP